MKRRTRVVAFLSIVVLGWVGSPIASADPGDGYTICGETYDASNTFAWETVESRYARQVAANEYRSIVASLRGELLASAAQTDKSLTTRFDLAAARLERVFPAQCSDFEVFKDEGGRDLRPTTYALFHAEPTEAILLSDGCDDAARVKQTQEMRHLAGSFKQLCVLALRDSMGDAALRIEAIEAQFDRYLFEGFPMFPWEALANSWFLSKKHLADGPPRDQLVLVHPVAGVIMKTTTFAEASPDIALGVDLVGWVHYPARLDYRSWWGLSAMASVANDRGTGLGLALQWDNFRLAATYHDDDRDAQLFDGRPSVFLGLDLYHFVKEKYRTCESYRKKLGELEKQPD